MDFTVKKCDYGDIEKIVEIGSQTFHDAFGAVNEKDFFDKYISEAFAPEQIEKEIGDPSIDYFFCSYKGQLAGYLKINEANSQTEINDPDSLELERIYVLKDFQNMGLGKRMLKFAFEVALQRSKEYLWLGVWEHNDGALRLYKKMGFVRFGAHDFYLGPDRQTDYLLRIEKALMKENLK